MRCYTQIGKKVKLWVKVVGSGGFSRAVDLSGSFPCHKET